MKKTCAKIHINITPATMSHSLKSSPQSLTQQDQNSLELFYSNPVILYQLLK